MKQKYLQSFGRTKSRKLRVGAVQLMKEVLPRVELRDLGTLELQEFGSSKLPTILEIGFGGGEHLLHQALANPQNKYIGCEPFLNGTVNLLRQIEGRKLDNIRIYNGDFRILAESLPDNVFDKIYILFPDPWPKKKQNKRRLISEESLKTLVRLMKNKRKLMIATDHMDYAEWILQRVLSNPNLNWLAKSKVDWQTPFAGHTATKYQNKALIEGRNSVFFEIEINK